MIKYRILKIINENPNGITSSEISFLLRIKNITSVRSILTILMKEGLIKHGDKRDCLVRKNFCKTYVKCEAE